jgi:hypothetical protein
MQGHCRLSRLGTKCWTVGGGAIDSGEKLAGDIEEGPIDHGLTNRRHQENERTITSSPRRSPMAQSRQGWLAARRDRWQEPAHVSNDA